MQKSARQRLRAPGRPAGADRRVRRDSARCAGRHTAVSVLSLVAVGAALVAVGAALVAGLGGCGLFGPSGPGYRTFAMGFTPFPYANTGDATLEAWNIIARDGDLAVIHLDGGVPWQEALDGSSFPSSFVDELTFDESQIPLGHAVYLAVTPISPSRNRLAGYRNDFGTNQPLPPPWDTYEFDSPPVIDAFINYCEYMIELFQPDYFAYAIEANMLRTYAPSQWSDFVYLAGEVYTTLKLEYPGLPVFITFQVDAYHNSPSIQAIAIQDLVSDTDVMALSAYPFARPLSDPADLEPDYFTAVSDIAPGLPFAIAETGWPAEDVDEPYPTFIYATEATQEQYVDRLLNECETRNALFLCWFFSRDYDDFWETDLQYASNAASFRLWRDTGLLDGDGYERPSMGLWRQELVIPR
jgi:hypothetical protein